MGKVVAACTGPQEMVDLVLMLSVCLGMLHWSKAAVS